MTAPDQIRLVIVFGGRSAEHDISCVSARHVLAAADPERYNIEALGITRDGSWVSVEGAAAALAPSAENRPDHLTAAGPSVEALSFLAQSSAATTVVWPALHGPLGEDGTVQGLLEMAAIAYVGAGVLASALCMDKVACKDHLAAHGIPQGRYRWVTVDDVVRQPDGTTTSIAAEVEAAAAAFGMALFVKPANMGSSVGVSRATTVDEAIAAVELAASYDREVIIEEEIIGRELEIAVLGNEEPRASVAGEIRPGAAFYSYQDKYEDGADLQIPAVLTDEQLAEMQRLAIGAYRACKVEGLARVDFFYEPARGWLVNEINTMPGFTPISMYPKIWAAAGLDYPSLIDALVDLALARYQRQARHTRTDH